MTFSVHTTTVCTEQALEIKHDVEFSPRRSVHVGDIMNLLCLFSESFHMRATL